MLSCKEVTFLISESMDRWLSLHQRADLNTHLRICKFCPRYRRQLLLTRETLRRYARKLEDNTASFPETSLSPEARERIRVSLIRS